jgi:predicted transcriptional regulator
MLSLLQAQIMDNRLFSLLVLGTLITMIISSVELQRKLKKIIHFKVGTSELGFMPIYFRRVVSDTTVISVMDREYPKTSSDISIKDFSAKNSIEKTPFLVFDNSRKLVGLISKREIKRAHKKTQELITISDVMHTKFHTAQPDDYLYSVIQKMNSHPFDMIPIIDPKDAGKIIGIVTTDGIMKLLTETKTKEN